AALDTFTNPTDGSDASYPTREFLANLDLSSPPSSVADPTDGAEDLYTSPEFLAGIRLSSPPSSAGDQTPAEEVPSPRTSTYPPLDLDPIHPTAGSVVPSSPPSPMPTDLLSEAEEVPVLVKEEEDLESSASLPDNLPSTPNDSLSSTPDNAPS